MVSYLLKCLLIFSFILNLLTFFSGLGFINIHHILFAIFTFLITLFIKAFLLFFFLGLKKLFQESFESIDENYQDHLLEISRNQKRLEVHQKKIFSWTFLNITLLSLTSFLGASLLPRFYHFGLSLSHMITLFIALIYELYALTQVEKLLRGTKYLLNLKDWKM